MFKEAVHVDITFEEVDDRLKKAHRDVLTCVSCVFASMFRHDLKEKLTEP